MSPQCLPPSFGSIWLTIRAQMRFEDFQDGHIGGHLRRWPHWGPSQISDENYFSNSESMSLRCLPSSLGSIPITVWEAMSFEKFQDGPHGCHLGCQYGTNLAVLNLQISPMPPTKFQLNPTYLPEQISFQDFQAGHHGGHLGYWNGTSLAILNLHVTPMPPTKVGLNPTYRSAADMVWRFWISERNNFSNSESLHCSDASHQVSAQSNLQFGRCC